MVHYLIEFRFQGKAKSQLKELIWEIDEKWRIGNSQKKRPVPHITLVGPFHTKDERKLINNFYDVCSRSQLIEISVNGFNTFEVDRVIYLDIEPSEKLQDFRGVVM